MTEVESLRREFAERETAIVARMDMLAKVAEAQERANLLLIRHLAAQGFVDLLALQRDLEMMADIQNEADDQDSYAMMAGNLAALRQELSSSP